MLLLMPLRFRFLFSPSVFFNPRDGAWDIHGRSTVGPVFCYT